MITHKFKGHKLTFFNDINQLPIDRFVTYNLMMLIDSGLGGDMSSVDDHIGTIDELMRLGKVNDARQRLMNMRNNLYFINEKFNPELLSYAAIIYSLDGKPIKDYSTEGLQSILDRLAKWGITKSYIDEKFNEAKKKIFEELKLYFPGIFTSIHEDSVIGHLKRRTNLVLDEILEGVENSKSIDTIDRFLYDLAKPKEFSGQDGVEVNYIKSYQEMSHALSMYTKRNAKEMSTMEYYQAFEMYKKHNKRKKVNK